MKAIGKGAFAGTSIASVNIPGSVTVIGEGAFEGSWITSVSIPDSVTKIGVGAFSGCTSLASIVISWSVKAIEGEAFGMWSKPFWNIRYEGTMEEWEAVYKAPDWNKKLSTREVVCSDGAVAIGYFTQSTALPGMEAGKDMGDDLGAGNGSAAVDSGNASGVLKLLRFLRLSCQKMLTSQSFSISSTESLVDFAIRNFSHGHSGTPRKNISVVPDSPSWQHQTAHRGSTR